MIEAVGWLATAIFAGSYFIDNRSILQLIQACSAGLWVLYGIFIDSSPVIVANCIIITIAIMTTVTRRYRKRKSTPSLRMT